MCSRRAYWAEQSRSIGWSEVRGNLFDVLEVSLPTEGKTLTCHWRFYALAHASPPPCFCLCPKSKSSLAEWQEVHWQNIRPEWNGVSHVWSICQAGRWKRERDNLFESSILCRSLDLADGWKKKETVTKFYPTPSWSKASWHQSRWITKQCLHCTSKSSSTLYLPYLSDQ